MVLNALVAMDCRAETTPGNLFDATNIPRLLSLPQMKLWKKDQNVSIARNANPIDLKRLPRSHCLALQLFDSLCYY